MSTFCEFDVRRPEDFEGICDAKVVRKVLANWKKRGGGYPALNKVIDQGGLEAVYLMADDEISPPPIIRCYEVPTCKFRR